MKAFVFYLLLPVLYIIALLPFWCLYRLSDFLFIVIYYGVGYRKKVVYKNLKNAFPEKSEEEIIQIMQKYYRFFCDMILETLKMLTLSAKTMKKRAYFDNLSIYEKLHREERSFILMLGHYGSWEWGSAAFELHTNHHILVIYKPLSNTYIDTLVRKMRTRFGQEATTMKNTLRNIIKLKKQLTATAFIADQRPDPKNAYWSTFFGQEAGFLWGTEKIAQKMDYPIVFCTVQRPKRGYYEIHSELLFEHPKNTKEGDITEKFVRRLEEDIRKRPELWLWSHDRWKHQKPMP